MTISKYPGVIAIICAVLVYDIYNYSGSIFSLMLLRVSSNQSDEWGWGGVGGAESSFG